MADSICVLAATELGLKRLKEVDAYSAVHKGCVRSQSARSVVCACPWWKVSLLPGIMEYNFYVDTLITSVLDNVL